MLLAVTGFDLVLMMARNKNMLTVIISFHEQTLSSSWTCFERGLPFGNYQTGPFLEMPFRYLEIYFCQLFK